MLTTNLLGLLAGLTILTGRVSASPIMARQGTNGDVAVGHHVQASEHTTIPDRPTGALLPKRNGASHPEGPPDAAITPGPRHKKRAEVSQEGYKSAMNSLGEAYALAEHGLLPVAIAGSSMDSYKANNVVVGGTSNAAFKSSVDSLEGGITAAFAAECPACLAMNSPKETAGAAVA